MFLYFIYGEYAVAGVSACIRRGLAVPLTVALGIPLLRGALNVTCPECMAASSRASASKTWFDMNRSRAVSSPRKVSVRMKSVAGRRWCSTGERCRRTYFPSLWLTTVSSTTDEMRSRCAQGPWPAAFSANFLTDLCTVSTVAVH